VAAIASAEKTLSRRDEVQEPPGAERQKPRIGIDRIQRQARNGVLVQDDFQFTGRYFRQHQPVGQDRNAQTFEDGRLERIRIVELDPALDIDDMPSLFAFEDPVGRRSEA
jgi:hypothetical protein